MLGMPQTCVTNQSGTTPVRIKSKHFKIIDTAQSDFFEQLFDAEKITIEQWQLITDIRRLAFCARRSQGIRVRLQSHSQYWGMPLVCSDDGYVNARAERRWKVFMFYLKPFIDHQWLDTQLLELLLFGGHVLCADDVMDRRLPRRVPAFGNETVHHMLLVIEYVYEKVHRRRGMEGPQK